jgi:anti-sigma-K factor RskA
MSTRDHISYREEIGAYLLGALTDLERQAFEHHLEGCAECREEVERLRPAAEVLPRSVEQVEPPPSLKASLMKVVEEEARERTDAPANRSFWERVLPRFSVPRPALAVGAAALALGLLAGLGVAQLGGDDGRTVTAVMTGTQAQGASAELEISDDGGTLVANDLAPPPQGSVFKVWVLRRGAEAPRPDAVFLPGRDGSAAVPVQGQLKAGDQVLVTSERDPQAQAPEGMPFIAATVPA